MNWKLAEAEASCTAQFLTHCMAVSPCAKHSGFQGQWVGFDERLDGDSGHVICVDGRCGISKADLQREISTALVRTPAPVIDPKNSYTHPRGGAASGTGGPKGSRHDVTPVPRFLSYGPGPGRHDIKHSYAGILCRRPLQKGLDQFFSIALPVLKTVAPVCLAVSCLAGRCFLGAVQ